MSFLPQWYSPSLSQTYPWPFLYPLLFKSICICLTTEVYYWCSSRVITVLTAEWGTPLSSLSELLTHILKRDGWRANDRRRENKFHLMLTYLTVSLCIHHRGTAAPYPQTPPWSHFTHVPQSVEWGLIVHNGYKYLLQKWAPQKHHHNNIIFRSDVTFKLLISFVSIKILVIFTATVDFKKEHVF